MTYKFFSNNTKQTSNFEIIKPGASQLDAQCNWWCGRENIVHISEIIERKSLTKVTKKIHEKNKNKINPVFPSKNCGL